MAVAPDGGFVITWEMDDAFQAPDVIARRFDAAGVAQGSELLVNSYTTGWQADDAVAIDNAGNFVVMWAGAGQGVYHELFGQRFDSSGMRVGAEFRPVNTPVDNQQPSVAMAAGGEFVVVWSHFGGSSSQILGQRYDSSGSPLGAAFQVNSTAAGSQVTPDVDVDGSGNFVVVWQSGSYVRGQRFTADGVSQGTEFQISSPLTTGGHPQASRSDNGAFVVAWWAMGAGNTFDVFARRFDAGGSPLGIAFVVNEFTTGTQNFPDVAVDIDGDFVITWRSLVGSEGVFARRYDSAGVPGNEFRVNAYTTGGHYDPSVATDPAGNFVVTWRSYENGTRKVLARRYAGGLSASALAVDGSAGPASNGNGVFETGETVAVAPSWLNANFGAETFVGAASSFTGPGAPSDPTYTIADGDASYGTVASGATASCTAAANCYSLGTTVPSTRLALHWDATFRETISPANLGAAKTWTLHIGDSFADVARASGFYRFIETLLHHGVTGGCNATQYCPSASTTREQMAVFVLVAKDGAGNIPPACTTPMFNDVPASSPFCRWIEDLARRGVVAGCGGGNYCPAEHVTREQVSVFVLRTLDPALVPPACAPPNLFSDVPETSPFCRWIEELARRGVVSGCGGGNYCPTATVTREQMAVFLSVTFGLMLYGP